MEEETREEDEEPNIDEHMAKIRERMAHGATMQQMETPSNEEYAQK
jgi:hypothetical protein